ncbi:30S ribosomal protein S17 [Candidatus Dependentiae bacterium]|nr:30S ribosomal protein S17 [Candidatus Dependentiae bacterium]
MEKTQKNSTRIHLGTVISDAMDKTVVVAEDRTYRHPAFGKVMRATKRYKVHDESEQAQVGDLVEFCEGRPVSKTKYMYLTRVVKPGSV